MKKIFLTLNILCSSVGLSIAQNVASPDCASAPNMCGGDLLPFSTGQGLVDLPAYGGVSNPSANPGGVNAGCLASGENNPNWFVITITNSGLLEFELSSQTGSGIMDWIMWEYDSNTCGSILADSLAPIACNQNYSSDGSTGIASAQNLPSGSNVANFEAPISVTAGQEFIIMMSNYSSQVGNFNFNVLGDQVVCNAVAELASETIGLNAELMTFTDAIAIKGPKNSFDLKMIDLQGRIVAQEANLSSEVKVNTSHLESAMYVIYVETEKGTKSFSYYKN